MFRQSVLNIYKSASSLWVPSYLQVTRSFWKKNPFETFRSYSRRLERLEQYADRFPSNTARQAEFLGELNSNGRYRDVIQRIRSGKFSIDQSVENEYKKAIWAEQQSNSTTNQQPPAAPYSSQPYAALPQQPFPPYHNYNYYYQQPPPPLSQQPPPPSSFSPYTNPSISNPQSTTTNYDNSSRDNKQEESDGAENRGNINSQFPPVGHRDNPINVQLSGPIPTSRFGTFMNGMSLLLSIGIMVYIFSFFFSAVVSNNSKTGGGSILERLVGNTNFEVNEKSTKTFKDIKGVDECLDEVKEVVDFLKHPNKYKEIGAKLPKGVLLVGQPGVGKTLLAKAIAGEAGVPFFYASGSEFDEVFVGVGASRIRGLFENAKKKSPCIIFIDEIDALASKRRMREVGGGNNQTINQLLSELDGFKPTEGVIVVGATNFVDALDPALLRPGRFDKIVEVPTPDVKGRSEILQLYAKNKKISSKVDFKSLASRTIGFTGAHIENLMNEAAINAVKKNRKEITQDDVEYAFDRIVLGLEHKSILITHDDQIRTAIHESGHALAAILAGKKDLHKVTITPRGKALGVTHYLPNDSKHTTKSELITSIERALGGVVAEEIIFGKDYISTGATSDLTHATRIARDIVVRFGMSNLGTIDFSPDYREDGYPSKGFFSEETKREIDTEIKRIVDEAYGKVKNRLSSHEKELRLLADELVKKEVLSGKEVLELLKKNGNI